MRKQKNAEYKEKIFHLLYARNIANFHFLYFKLYLTDFTSHLYTEQIIFKRKQTANCNNK